MHQTNVNEPYVRNGRTGKSLRCRYSRTVQASLKEILELTDVLSWRSKMTNAESESAAGLRPCIAELLRTGHYPNNLVLRVDKMVTETRSIQDRRSSSEQERPDDTRLQTHRLLLTDGELGVQAVIHRDFHCLIQSQVTIEGQLITLINFSLQRGARINGTGHVAYLAVDEYRNYDGDEEDPNLLEPSRRTETNPAARPAKRPLDAQAPVAPQIESPNKRQKTAAGRAKAETAAENDDDFETFETLSLPASAILQRRLALQSISGNGRLKWSQGSRNLILEECHVDGQDDFYNDETEIIAAALTQPSVSVNDRPKGGTLIPSPKSSTNSELSENAMKLHTLASLLDIEKVLPRRNYVCKVFAVITWVSSAILKRPGLPEKRHIKIHDPTIARRYSGVSISVFVNARHFKPAVGTIALFTGLTAQKWDGEVILNAYERDCAGKEWFIDDEIRLNADGFDVGELRLWWHKWIQK